MRIVRSLALVLAGVLLSACGGADDGESTSTTSPTATASSSAGAGDEDSEAAEEDGSDESSVGTLTIDGEEFDVVLGGDIVLDMWEDQSPRDPCALDSDPISLVLVHESDEARFIFVAEGPAARKLTLTLVDSYKSTGYTAERARAKVGEGTFDYSGTLEGNLGPVQVDVAVAC